MAVHDPLIPVPVTHDRLFGGAVHFTQPAEGYRAAVDGLLLATFAGRAQRFAVDLGAGAGMITLALLARQFAPHVLAVEPDDAYHACLAHNVAANGFDERTTLVKHDARSIARARRGCADLVVANPPFYDATTHTPPRDEHAQRARSGMAPRDPLAEFVIASRTLLGRAGRACLVWPAHDLQRLLDRAQASGLAARRMRSFHASADAPARRVLVEFRPGRPGGLAIEPPWIQFDAGGHETPAFRAITHVLRESSG